MNCRLTKRLIQVFHEAALLLSFLPPKRSIFDIQLNVPSTVLSIAFFHLDPPLVLISVSHAHAQNSPRV